VAYEIVVQAYEKRGGKNIKNLVKDVIKPRYYCEKCARVSKKKEHLCKPVKIVPLSRG
jgi:hypothetical protein